MPPLITQPAIITRKEWKAMAARQSFPPTKPTCVVWHHTAGLNRALITDPVKAYQYACSLARSIQVSHMDSNLWSDSGMHWMVTREGLILEGRDGSLAAAKAGHCIRGAHAHDQDTGADANDSWGIEHEGTYGAAVNGRYIAGKMPDAMWKATLHLTAWLMQQCKLDSQTLMGHKDTGCRTACPGDWVERKFPEARRAIHNLKLGVK